MSFSLKANGAFEKTKAWLNRLLSGDMYSVLDRYGQMGVEALAAATPQRTGLTASSWEYTIDSSGSQYSINWLNSNVNNGVPIAVIIQYGHGTGTGGYVAGRDYINPALQPIFDNILADVMKEVAP
jgi:hypothetical protein